MPRERSLPNRADSERECADWNAVHPIGTPVKAYWRLPKRAEDHPQRTTTQSEAFVADSDDPVIFLTGISGYYHLHHVEVDRDEAPGTPTPAGPDPHGVRSPPPVA